jgi:ATP-dependent helicase/nuclease subunit B
MGIFGGLWRLRARRAVSPRLHYKTSLGETRLRANPLHPGLRKRYDGRMGASVHLVSGPTGCGKTSRLLTEYRRAIAAGLPGCALWIAPNRRGAAAIRDQLVDPGLPQCANPQSLTFAQLAQRILDASAAPMRPLTELMKRRLLKELLGQAMNDGGRPSAKNRLVYFAPIAHTPGFIDLLATTIRQWKQLEIWPDDLAAAFARRGMAAKDQELLWLYSEYQRVLNEHQLYDAEGRIWSARSRLQGGQHRPFERVRHVFVDGFTDFTRTEYEMLEVLAERTDTMTISLPLDQGAGGRGHVSGLSEARGELFAKPFRTLAQLNKRFPTMQVEPIHHASTLSHIEASLFRAPADATPPRDMTGIEIVATAGQLGEIEWLARRIKQLLTTGDPETPASRAIAAGDILVIFRSTAEVGPLVRDVFESFGIPTAVEYYSPLGNAACTSALLGWLRLAIEEWPFRQTLAMLAHNSLRPDWPEWQNGQAAIAAEHLVRTLQIPVGQSTLLRRVAHWAEQQPATSSKLQIRTQRAQLAFPLLRRLDKTLSALPEWATATEWRRALALLANQLGIARFIVSSARETAAWDATLAALHDEDRLQAWCGEPPSQLSRQEIFERLIEIAETVTLPPEHDEVGRVRVMSAASARTLSAPYVFVAGLTEKAFPAPDRDDRLYNDAETIHLIEAGLPLPTRAARSHEEMLLFYETLTRATHKLTLSYPGLDAKAQPLSPSPYLTELERACGEGRITRRSEIQLSPVPANTDVFSERDRRVRAVVEAQEGQYEMLGGLLRSPLTPGLAPAKGRGENEDRAAGRGEKAVGGNLVAALKVMHHRSHGDGFGPFEGMLRSDAAVARLAARYGADRSWSASQLEQYAACPFQFFAERELKLEAVAELALETDYAKRGKLLHNAITQLHRLANELAKGPASLGIQSLDQFEKAAVEVLDALVQNLQGDDPLNNALLEVDRRLLTTWLANYYEQHAAYDALWKDFNMPLRPAHFEVAFGLSEGPTDDEDVNVIPDADLASARPLELVHEGETLRIRGRIDRIDLGEIGGRSVFNVVDFKSGRAKSLTADTVSSGATLQLPLYALAVEQLLLADQQAIPWRAGYWFVKENGFSARRAMTFHEHAAGGVVEAEAWTSLRTALTGLVFALARGVKNGQFPMASRDDKCTSFCPYRTVCRVGQVRSLEKAWQPPESVQ